MTGRPRVSVVLPTREPGVEFGRLLRTYAQQQGVGTIETIVVDSGSAEEDLVMATAHGARVIRIRPDEYSHSHARNLGADAASGELLLFTVQDAMPPSSTWLRALTEALDRLDVVALSCREEPRPDADLFARVGTWGHTRYLSPHGRDVVMTAPSSTRPEDLRRNGQLSDVACLIRRDVFQQFRHRGDYAEDLDLGLRLTAAGHRLAFLTSEHVVHSHDRQPWYHMRRGFVDECALRRVLPVGTTGIASPATVAGDVASSYRIADGIARTVVRPGLSSVGALADSLHTAFAGARAGMSPRAAALDAHAYIDPQALRFAEWLEHRVRPATNGPYIGGMLHAIPHMIGMMAGYLAERRIAIDDAVLDDVRRAIYRIWAFQGGVQLGAASCEHPDSDAALLDELRQRLAPGI